MFLGFGFLDSLSGFKKSARSKFSSGDIEEASEWQDGLLKKRTKLETLTSNLSRANFFVLFLLLFFLFGVLHTRLFELQIIKGEINKYLADSNRYRHLIVRPPRGRIYSAEGELLAYDKPGFRIVLEVSEFAEEKDYSPILSVLDMEKKTMEESIEFAEKNGLPLAVLAEGVEQETALKVETIKGSFPGIKTEISPLRYYPYPELYAHVLGYVSEISSEELSKLDKRGYTAGSRIGKTGLEKYYEEKLRGAPGEQIWELNSTGERLRQVGKQDAQAGLDLNLSLQHGLQQTAFNALKKGIEESPAHAGTVIVQDVQTGHILSMVSLPSYNNNLFSQGLLSHSDYKNLINNARKPLLNRAVQGEYPPGSTFKMVMATAALSEEVVTPETIIVDRGAISVGSYIYRCWKPEGHGPQNLVQAIANSCDVYFYTIGGGYRGRQGLGVEKIAEWSRKFGLGSVLNCDLLGEKAGLVPDPGWKLSAKKEDWYIGNTYHLSIGQGDLLTTPLQVNALTTTVANFGTLFEPRLEKSSAVVLRRNIALPETFQWVQKGMRAAVTEGTAYPLRNAAYTSAAKTGTAEIGKQDATHAWFTAFAPYENPEVSVTVFLEEGGEGSHDAGPVAREILDYFFSSE